MDSLRKEKRVSVAFRLESYDVLYNSITTPTYIINNYDISDIEVKEQVDQLLLTNLVNEDLSLVPSCDCGELKGYSYIGMTHDCGTTVKSMLDTEVDFKVWIRQPEGIAPLISPDFLFMLLNRYTITKPSIALVEYIIQTNYRIEDKSLSNIDELHRLDFILKQRGIKRGYNSFVENFDEIIEILEMNFSKGNKADKSKFIKEAISVKSGIFSEYMPVLNKSLFILDHSDGIKYADGDMSNMLNSINRIAGIDVKEMSFNNKQNRLAKTLCELAKFYSKYLDDKVYKKYCLYRQQIVRTRTHYTLRAVISSRVDEHRVDELLFPWSGATSVFRTHLISGLIRRGYTYNDAQDHIHEHVNVYSPVLDSIFEEIIAGSTEFGFPNMTNRNPSLGRGSLPFTGITGIKKDPRDKTVTISPHLAALTNLDFDGDMMHFALIFTSKAFRGALAFAVRNNVLGMQAPNQFSNSISIAKATIGTVSNWLYTEDLD